MKTTSLAEEAAQFILGLPTSPINLCSIGADGMADFAMAVVAYLNATGEERFAIAPADRDLFAERVKGQCEYLAVIDRRVVAEVPTIVTELSDGIRLLKMGAYSNGLDFPAVPATADQVARYRAWRTESLRKDAANSDLKRLLDEFFATMALKVKPAWEAFHSSLTPEQLALLQQGEFYELQMMLKLFSLRP